MMNLALLFAAVVGFTDTAQATVWEKDVETVWGRMDRPQGDLVDGDVVLDYVRAHHCSGGTYVDFTVGTSVDPVAGFGVPVTTTGDYCSVSFVFSTDIEIDGDGTAGTFTIESTDTEVTFEVSGNMGWEAVSGWTVTGGTMQGAAFPQMTAWTTGS